MKKIVLPVLSLFVLIACNENKNEKTVSTSGETKTDTVTTAPAVSDSAAIRNVIMDFYKWYQKEWKQLANFDLYSGIKKKDQPPYKINWKEVDRLQAYIRDSVPQLGEEFLKNQRIMLQQSDSAFKVDVKDDIPYGFDYDWYTASQEDASYLLDGISQSKKWMISVKGEDASVEIGAPDSKDYLSGSLLLYVGMKKENGQWKIARIGGNE